MHGIVSTLRDERTIALVYSSLGAHSRFRENELPAAWFIEVLGPLGHASATVRQTLYRMEKKGQILGRRMGRRRFYRLSPYGQAAVDATYRKMTLPRAFTWDGLWSLVILNFAVADRVNRDRVRSLLELEGCASMSRGIYVHPQDRISEVREAIKKLGREDSVLCFRGQRSSDEPDDVLVERLWDIKAMQKRYREFVTIFSPLLRRKVAARNSDEAFALRLALAIRFSEIAWDDPELPDELLPNDWAGARARDLTNCLYPKLLPGALAYGAEILAATRQEKS